MVNTNPTVFFDVAVGVKGNPTGRIVMELFADTTPFTAENFRALCTGEKGIGLSGKPLHFKGSIFHCIFSDYIWVGGDITHGDGSGGESIYGPQFPDENFVRRHDRPGILSMANKDEKDTNGSQFHIGMKEVPHLNGESVVFGQVLTGFDVIRLIGQMVDVTDDPDGIPSYTVTIADCGEINPESGRSASMEVGVAKMIDKLGDLLRAAYMKIVELEKALEEQATAQKNGQGEGSRSWRNHWLLHRKMKEMALV